MSSNSRKRITEIANLLAVAVVLEFVSNMILPSFKLGGGISLASSVPVLLISYRYGIKYGVASGCIFGFIQILMDQDTISKFFDGGYFASSGMGWLWILLNYFVAQAAVGLGGILRKSAKSRKQKFMLGSLTALGIRYGVHVLSYWLCFGRLAKWYFNRCDITTITLDSVSWVPDGLLPLVFALFYNCLYMLPEIALAMVATWILSNNRKIVTRVKTH